MPRDRAVQARRNVCHGGARERPFGFTLVEVLVALLVLTLGIAVALKLAQASVALSERQATRTYAHWVALNRIALLELAVPPVQEGPRDGVAEMAGHSFAWHAEVTRAGAGGRLTELYVEVREHRPHAPLAASVTATVYR